MTRLEALEAVAKAASEALMAGEKRNGIILDGRTAKVISLRAALAALAAVPVEGPCPECGGMGERMCPSCHDGGVNSGGESCRDCVAPSQRRCPRCNGTGRTT